MKNREIIVVEEKKEEVGTDGVPEERKAEIVARKVVIYNHYYN